ncbi:MAG: branched-chain amino acid ABC transporter permease [Chloroflexi bacterium]|nr:branched-chain amino acid ABC transporter permease [Chloroflexota bacterium]
MTTIAQQLRRIDGSKIAVWVIGGGILLFITVGSIATLTSGEFSAEAWIDLFVFGLAQGSIYALIALGYTLVYGVLFMINFAHGEVFMGGMYIAFFVARAFDESGFLNANPILSLVIITLVSTSVSTFLAVMLERIAYRPLRNSPRLVYLITAIGASFFLQYAFRGIFGPSTKVYPDIGILQGEWSIFGIEILKRQAIVIVAAVLMMVLLQVFVNYTKAGRAIRAVAEDREAAALMGINVDRSIVTTFVVGGAMAGVAGILYAISFRQVTHTVGFIPGLKAFTAAVLGGIGNIPGAMVGGIFLGIFESVGPTLFFSGLDIPSPNQLKDVIAFTMLVLVLIFRPTGILGEAIDEKRA